MSWHTRPDREVRQLGETSPGLLYHKWHAYDDGGFEVKEARPAFLEDVARAVESVVASELYTGWHERYAEALRGLGVNAETTQAAATLWRLVAGFGTNPALETGIVLHPLYGFPYLPGSGVRGLVHHVAEMELLEGREDWSEVADPPLPEGTDLVSFLAAAERVKAILGSLTLERLKRTRRGRPVEVLGPATPRSLLARWRGSNALPKEIRARIDALLNRYTGGLVAFYDAVPAAGQKDLLQLDILNPHYPDYYNSEGTVPPSDDQNPNPVYFLAVRPGVRFLFPFRLQPLPAAVARDEAEKERISLLGGLSSQDLLTCVRGWLQRGLATWGAGAKTAAGYGYFQVEGLENRAGEPERSPRSPDTAAGAPAAPPATAAAGLREEAVPSTPSRPTGRKKISVEVLREEGGVLILRDVETGDEILFRAEKGVRMSVGERRKVRVVSTDKDGRVTKVQV